MCDECECNDGYCGQDCNLGDLCSCEGCSEIFEFPIIFGKTQIVKNGVSFTIVMNMESDEEFMARSDEGDDLFFFRRETFVEGGKLHYRPNTWENWGAGEVL